MTNPGMLALLALSLGGLVLMLATVVGARRTAPDLDEFLAGLGYEQERTPLDQPLVPRLARATYARVSSRLQRVLPRAYVGNVERQLAQAGVTGRHKVGEHLMATLGLAAAGAALAPLVPTPSPSAHVLALVLVPVVGFMLPSVRIKRMAASRSDAMIKDLPDIVDMLAIAVEAGSGFEAALSLICSNFTSPVTDELSVALSDMELGLPRQDALRQLRERVDVDAVRTLVLALLQADALGIPVGRVLRTQAAEVRSRRRAWAREKAAKLPVKIMFPLVVFIFPPIMAIVLAPAVGSFGKI
ncbi:MAG: type II secretion system F family protein [Acidimicrobiales bacterium]